MDTNLFSLFGSEEGDEQNLPKKQTPKKKNSKASKQTTIDLFAFDEEAQVAATPVEEMLADDTLALATNSDAIDQVTTPNAITSIPEEAASSPTKDDNSAEELNQPSAAVVEESKSIDEVETINITSPEIIEKNNPTEQLTTLDAIGQYKEAPVEELADTKLNAFEITPIAEAIDSNFNTEPSLDEYLASIEKQNATSNDHQLEEQYVQELLISDYSMFLDTPLTGTLDTETEASKAATDEKQQPSLPEWDLTKKYYTIGEVAKLFDVNTSHIRFWSKEFNFRLRTTRKGDRMYTPEDIERLRLIHELVKVKKHTIKGAKEILNTKSQKVTQTVDLKDNLKDLKNMLLGIQKKL